MTSSAAIPSQSLTEGFCAEAALDTLHDALIILGDGDEVVYANSAAEHLFSLSRAAFMRYGFAHVLGTEHPLRGLIGRVRETGHEVVERAMRFQRPGFEPIMVDVRVAHMHHAPHQVLLTFMIASEAVRLGEEDDKRSHRQMAGMAAVLAHEVKNPLSGIRGAAQLMERYLPEDSRDLSRLVIRECDRITHLVDEMDSFGNEQPARIESVNIHEVIDHVITLVSSSAQHKVDFERIYDPSLPPVLGNTDRLVQIVLNIVKNAIEATYATPSPKVTINTAYRHGVRIAREDGTYEVATPIEIAITDNGSGVPDDMVSLLFEPFVTSKEGGRGLGLPLVARYLFEMGGSIEHAASDAGTHFRIFLPEERLAL